MYILWQPNPLRTEIILSNDEKIILKDRVHIDCLEEGLSGAAYQLTKDPIDLEQLKREVGYSDYMDNDDAPIRKEIERQYGYALRDLTESHCGDCTCVPMTCSKCMTEEKLGINTMKGLSKYAASHISRLFGDKNTFQQLAQVWFDLDRYEPEATFDGAEEHFDRWRMYAREAADWLYAYKHKHFDTGQAEISIWSIEQRVTGEISGQQ